MYKNGILVFVILTIFNLSAIRSAEGVPFGAKLKSWNYYKWENITRQKFDFSCGAAALSTMMTAYFNDPVPESIILALLIVQLKPEDMEDRQLNGFSMLDIQNLAATIGYDVAGVKLPFKAINKLNGPIMVVLRENENEHFVVLKGVDEHKAYLADSVRGNIRMPLFRFFDQWNGVALVFGKKGVGLPEQHKLMVNMKDNYPETSSVRQMSRAFR